MKTRLLGRTGLRVPEIAFGCGPVSGLLTGSDFALQLATVQRALDAGVDWFDTAAGYGNGASEANLGRVLKELGASPRIATKVRVTDFDRLEAGIRASVQASLTRLGVDAVELLQLHNGITRVRGEEAASVSPADALQALEVFRSLQSEGTVRFVGLTGTGHPEALREVIRSGGFDTLQVPFNMLNPSAGGGPVPPGETDYGHIVADCAEQGMGMGVFAIRVFAGGALLGQPPSAHTLKTPYFPLALYERDSDRAKEMSRSARDAVRFVLEHPHVHSAIIGFGSSEHVTEVCG